jgi:carbonic anhydrase/acetyltransferase-like protein (isoleucine patch superfamily)
VNRVFAPLLPYRGIVPAVDSSAFVAPTASVIGDVHVGPESSIWYGAVIRGDVMPIRIGARTSIQDNAVLHATGGWAETIVGDRVTVGHSAILHGCRVGSDCLIGMGSIVLDDAEIGEWVMLGAGSLVTARTKIPAGVLAIGRPAKPVRDLRDEERERIREAAELYVGYGAEHAASLAARGFGY